MCENDFFFYKDHPYSVDQVFLNGDFGAPLMSNGFNTMLRSATPQVQDLARATRNLLFSIFPEVVEIPWERQKTIGYGVGPKKMSQHFCWIGLYTTHIILGFNYGATLDDPEHLLEGSGKAFRHYKIYSLKDLDRSELHTLICKAIADIRSRNNLTGT